MTLHKNEAGKLDAFAWPGGYSIRYLCADGETVCAKCANEWIEGDDNSHAWENQEPTNAYIHWEGPPIICAHCGKELESEYGSATLYEEFLEEGALRGRR